MPRFSYRARDRTGKLLTGFIEAEGEMAAAAQLREKRFHVLNIRPAPARNREFKLVDLVALFAPRVKIKELAIFCRRLSTILQAGIPILQGLSILTRQTENKTLRRALEAVVQQLEEGYTFSAALRQHPRVFPGILVSMVEAGEAGGVIDRALERMALHFEKEHDVREKVKSAMIYPMVLMVIGAIATSVIFTLVLPRFLDMLAMMNVELPLPTRIIMGISDFLRHSWYVLLSAAAVAGLVFKRWAATVKGKEVMDRLKLRLPVFGPLLSKIIISRFSRTLATLLHTGVPVLQALEIVKNTAGNHVVVQVLQSAEESVRNGYGIAEPIEKSGIFPLMVTRMMAIGEDTGAMDALLERIAEFYDREVNETVSRLSTLLEPVLIVGMAVVVGFVVISILLPMFKVISSTPI